MGPDHRRRSSAANTTKCCPKPSPPARPARPTTPRRPGRVLRRHERKQRGRYAFLESVAQPRTDRRLQRHAQPLLQRIRLPVVPRIRLRPAFRSRRARPGHRIGGDDGPPARRRLRQHAHPPIPRRRILARTRFPHVPLHEPCPAGRRHQDRHRSPPTRQTLLLGIALLAAQRLLARGFVGQPRLVRPLESATLLRPPGLRRPARIAPCTSETGGWTIFLVSDRRETVRGKLEYDGPEDGRHRPLEKHPQRNPRPQYQSERSIRPTFPGCLHGCSPGRSHRRRQNSRPADDATPTSVISSPQKELALPEADIRWSAEPDGGRLCGHAHERPVSFAPSWLVARRQRTLRRQLFRPFAGRRPHGARFRRNSPGTNSTGCCESPICNKPDKPTIRL